MYISAAFLWRTLRFLLRNNIPFFQTGLYKTVYLQMEILGDIKIFLSNIGGKLW